MDLFPGIEVVHVLAKLRVDTGRRFAGAENFIMRRHLGPTVFLVAPKSGPALALLRQVQIENVSEERKGVVSVNTVIRHLARVVQPREAIVESDFLSEKTFKVRGDFLWGTDIDMLVEFAIRISDVIEWLSQLLGAIRFRVWQETLKGLDSD